MTLGLIGRPSRGNCMGRTATGTSLRTCTEVREGRTVAHLGSTALIAGQRIAGHEEWAASRYRDGDQFPRLLNNDANCADLSAQNRTARALYTRTFDRFWCMWSNYSRNQGSRSRKMAALILLEAIDVLMAVTETAYR